MIAILEYLSCDGSGRNFSKVSVKNFAISKKAIHPWAAMDETNTISDISFIIPTAESTIVILVPFRFCRILSYNH